MKRVKEEGKVGMRLEKGGKTKEKGNKLTFFLFTFYRTLARKSFFVKIMVKSENSSFLGCFENGSDPPVYSACLFFSRPLGAGIKAVLREVGFFWAL